MATHNCDNRDLRDHHDKIKADWDRKQIISQIEKLVDGHSINTFVDLGANTGATAELVIEHFNPKKAWLFEPFTNAHELLKENTKDFSATEICIIEKGVYYGKTCMKAYSCGDSNPGGLFLKAVAEEYSNVDVNDENIQFELTTLEEHLNEEIDLMKIDIEGSEWNVIEHSDIIKNHTKFIVLERHWISNEETKEFIKNELPNFTVVLYKNEFFLKRKF